MRLPATGVRTSTALGGLVLAGLGLASGAALGRPRLAVARGEQAMVCPDTAALTAQVEAVLGRPALSQPRPDGPELGLDVEQHGQRDGEGLAEAGAAGAGVVQDALALPAAGHPDGGPEALALGRDLDVEAELRAVGAGLRERGSSEHRLDLRRQRGRVG
ncbi:MAG: hypothetical protein EOO75_16785, partial [Myxococcales bacterium]